MKQAIKALHVSIPDPCSESWEHMEKTGKGRFCSSCQKEVIDFSNFTDSELLEYFKNITTIPCGRFHRSQLNTPLFFQISKHNSRVNIYKRIAAILAFLSIKPSGVLAQTDSTSVIQVSHKKQGTVDTKKAIISGVVKDSYGTPLHGAEVIFNTHQVTKSDSNGKFHFEVEPETNPRPSLLQFIFPGFTTAVRSYHPAMQSMSFNVILETVTNQAEFYTGAPIITSAFQPFTFIRPKEHLSSNVKIHLSSIANAMRSNPQSEMQLLGYGDTKREINTANEMLKAVKAYFVEREGISESRIYIKVKSKEYGKLDRVDIFPRLPDEEPN